MNLHLREVICTSKARRWSQTRGRPAPKTLAPASHAAHASLAPPARRTATASGAWRCATCAATPSSTCACLKWCAARAALARGHARSRRALSLTWRLARGAQVLEKVAEEKVKRSDARPGGGGRGRGGRGRGDGEGGYGGDGGGRGRGGYGGRGEGRGYGRGEGRGGRGGGGGRGAGRGSEPPPEWA